MTKNDVQPKCYRKTIWTKTQFFLPQRHKFEPALSKSRDLSEDGGKESRPAVVPFLHIRR